MILVLSSSCVKTALSDFLLFSIHEVIKNTPKTIENNVIFFIFCYLVNDYLAKRDSEWMGQIHEFLGLKVGVVLNSMTNDERREAYNCDITYVTNNELGFDYLRDNMVIYKEQLVQRGLHYAIIDEVDSVLIDEARTPLIISGQSGKSTRLYEACDILAQQMKRGEDVPEYSKMDAAESAVAAH